MKQKRWLPLVSVLGAALLTSLVLLIVYRANELYPLGNKTLSWCDMNQQVVPLLCDLKDILAGKSSLFLSVANAGGMNFWGVFFFFLCSPFSFLVVFIEKADMLLFMNVLVLLKFATAAATSSVFFRRVFPRLGVLNELALSVSYALCGFGLMYYQNVIWLDMLWSFPLLLLSLLRLAEKKKPLCFIVMLSLSVVMNYYISYMLVMFLLLAAPLWLFLCTEKEERGRLALLFLLSCAVAAILTSVVWLPSLLQYFSSARGGDGLIASLSSGTPYGSYTTKMPLLFCTPLMFASLPFLPYRKNKRKTVFVLSLFLLMLFASFFEPINKMWQTGNYQSFPLRYGYMIVFFGLILTAMVLSEQKDAQKRWAVPVVGAALCVAAVGYAGWTLLENELKTLSNFTSTLWGGNESFLLLLLWFLIAFFAATWLLHFAKTGAFDRQLVSLFLCLFVCVTSVFNATVYIGTAASEDDAYRLQAELAGRIDDGSFYRVKTKEKYFVANGLGSLGYRSLGHYTSLTDQDYMFAMKKLGYSSYWMEVNSNGGTILTDAILRDRYTVTKTDSFAFSDDAVYRNGTYSLLRSAFELPAAVKLSADPALFEAIAEGERCEVQDALYRLYGGSESVVTRYTKAYAYGMELVKEDGLYRLTLTGEGTGRLRYEIDVTGKQALYFDAFKDISNRLREALNDTFTVAVNGRTVQQSYPNQSSNGLLYLGDFENETVIVSLTVKKDAVASSFGVFGMDADKVASLCESAEGCDLNVTGNRVTASTEGCKGEYLYISLPYDRGYKATVNGKAVPLCRVNDAFLALPLEDGENEIALVYTPRGFTAGLILTLCGIPLLALFLLLLHKKERLFESRATGKIGTAVLFAVGAGVFLLLYLFPPLVYLFC